MKKLLAVYCFVLLVNLSNASINMDALLANIARAPEKSIALVLESAQNNSSERLEIVRGCFTSLPDRAVAILSALVEQYPAQAPEMVKIAIATQPRMALEITLAALNKAPQEADKIRIAASEAAPDDLKLLVAAMEIPKEPQQALASPSSNARPNSGFPAQPLRPDVIASPSSR